MTDNARLDLDDEERLPWLEPAEDEDVDGLSPIKLLGFILVGLILLGIVVGGIWWVQNRAGGAPAGSDGEGTLIAAPAGDYKEKAGDADADAKKFAGVGDASYAASEGAETIGKIDERRLPEAPVAAAPTTPAQKPVATPAQKVTAKVSDATGARASKPVAAGPAPASGTIQLGAYGSKQMASDAWSKLSKRFAYLAPLAMSVEPVQVGNSTLYRLRVAAGEEAGKVCGKLKVAGENCIIVR